MIRTLWTILTVLALANLLAMGAFTGWLISTSRLDADRFNRVRAMLTETREAEETRLEDEARREAVAAALAEEERRSLIPPLTAADRLRNNDLAQEVDRQRVERMTREVRDLQRTLERERDTLDGRIEVFERDKAAFESMRRRIREIEGQDQFRKSVQHLQAQKPIKARDILQSLIDGGEIDQAVSYLNAMDNRQAAKVIGAFEEPAMAADLLERLRTRGTETGAP